MTFELEKDLKVAHIERGKERLKRQFEALEASSAKPSHKKRKLSILKYAVAAVFLIGITLISINFFSQRSNSEQLYAEFFEPYRNVIAPIERGDEPSTDEEKAFAYYELGKYQKAIDGFEALSSNTAIYKSFYIGISNMQLEQFDLAIKMFERYEVSGNRFKQQSQWYRSLCYLKLNDLARAKETLEILAKTHDFKALEAQKLLKKLN